VLAATESSILERGIEIPTADIASRAAAAPLWAADADSRSRRRHYGLGVNNPNGSGSSSRRRRSHVVESHSRQV